MHIARTRRIRTMAVVAVATGVLAGGVTAGTDLLGSEVPPAQSTDTIAQAGAARSAKGTEAKGSKAKGAKAKGAKAKGRKSQGMDCRTGALQARNKKFVKTVYEWPDNPGAVTIMPGPGRKEFEYKLEYSSKVSATFGMTYKDLSASLGFEVNKSESESDKTVIQLKEPVAYRVRAGVVHKQYSFNVYEEHGFWNWHGDYLVCQSYLKPEWVKKGSGTALMPWAKAFRATKAPKRQTH